MIDIPDENPDLEKVFISDKDNTEPRHFTNKNVVMSITPVTSQGSADVKS